MPIRQPLYVPVVTLNQQLYNQFKLIDALNYPLLRDEMRAFSGVAVGFLLTILHLNDLHVIINLVSFANTVCVFAS